MQSVDGVRVYARVVSGIDMKDLKGLADEAKKTVGSGVVAIVGVGPDSKAGLVVAVTKDLTDRFNAIDLVRAGSAALGGKGRRRPARHGAGRRTRTAQPRRQALDAVTAALGQRAAA